MLLSSSILSEVLLVELRLVATSYIIRSMQEVWGLTMKLSVYPMTWGLWVKGGQVVKHAYSLGRGSRESARLIMISAISLRAVSADPTTTLTKDKAIGLLWVVFV